MAAASNGQIGWTEATVIGAYAIPAICRRAIAFAAARNRKHDSLAQKYAQTQRTALKGNLDLPTKLEEIREVARVERRHAEFEMFVGSGGRCERFEQIEDRVDWAEDFAMDHDHYIWRMVGTPIAHWDEDERDDGTWPLRLFLKRMWREVEL